MEKETIEQNEKQKDDLNNKSSASGVSLENYDNIKKICGTRCSICHSGILDKIHLWKGNSMTFDEIVERAFSEYNVKISTASLSRHFKNYNEYKLGLATQIIKNDTINEITAQSVHIRKTVELLDLAYDKILAQMKANTYKVDISDLEKLAKMRYQILNGENPDDKDLMAIFQKATDDFGVDVQQGVLFKM